MKETRASAMLLTNHKSMKVTKNLQLEGLRGIASLWVFGGHLFADEVFYPDGKILNQFTTDLLLSLNPGHLGVLFFFILSGYVIGMVYPQNEEFSSRKYLLKRWIRIWPMYAIAVLISCMIVPAKIWIILGNLLFLNPDISPAIPGNPVLWSVSYEFGFYLVFPIIFRINFLRKNKAYPLLAITIAVSVISNILSNSKLHPLFVWINGFSLWCIGLVIAWNSEPKKETSGFHPVNSNILPGIFIATALNSTMPGFISILKVIGIPHPIPTFTPTLGDLMYLTAILPVFLSLIKVKIPKRIEFTLFFIACMQVLVVVTGSILKDVFLTKPQYFSAVLLVLMAILLKIKPINFTLNTLAPIGSISYGIYIYHMPIMYLIAKIPSFKGAWIEWLIRIMLSIFIVLFFAYLVEIKLQPKIRNFFLRFS